MRQFFFRVASGLEWIVFILFCIVGFPVMLLTIGVDAVGEWIRNRWPNNERAEAVRFWFKLLAPMVLIAMLLVAIATSVSHLRAIHQAKQRDEPHSRSEPIPSATR